MNVLQSIFGKIFPHNHPAVAAKPAPAPNAAPPPQPSTRPEATMAAPVDVNAILSGLAAKNSQQLNWRTSIVDLLKVLGLDSSLPARQALARELHYAGDMHDSAAMNIWLQGQVMQKLAENGGKVPEDMKH